jgi:hypothetical protein
MAGIVLKLAFIGIFPAVALSLHGAWDPQLAAKYLDARQHGRKPRSAPALVAQAPCLPRCHSWPRRRAALA